MNIKMITLGSHAHPGSGSKVKYKEIKKIPKLPCACCGEPMIVKDRLTEIYGKISRPLSVLLKKGVFRKWEKFNDIISVLMEFAKKFPKKSLIEIIKGQNQFEELKKAIIAAVDLFEDKTPEEKNDIRTYMFGNLCDDSKSNMRSSGVVIRRLMALKPFLRGTQREVFEQLEIYSRKYPDKTLTEIINLNEIFKYHEMKNLLQRTETREKIDYHFENVKNIIRKILPESDEFFDELKEEALDIFAKYKDPQIRIAKIKLLYETVLKEKNGEKCIKKVHDEFDKMPTTFATKDSFFVFARNHEYNDSKIITSIFESFLSTFEHIVPQSHNGKDSIGNGLGMHQMCNRRRGNIPYNEFFTYHSDMPKNIVKQVNFIAKEIIKGRLTDEFRFLPLSLSRTLFQYTNGKINLDLTKHCERGIEKANERIEDRKEIIENLEKNRQDKLNQRQLLLEQIQELDSEMTGIDVVVEDLVNENKNETRLKSSYEEHIAIKKRQKARANLDSKQQNK